MHNPEAYGLASKTGAPTPGSVPRRSVFKTGSGWETDVFLRREDNPFGRGFLHHDHGKQARRRQSLREAQNLSVQGGFLEVRQRDE